jgi:16S rRNA (guanine527-N7)-methyltransferase
VKHGIKKVLVGAEILVETRQIYQNNENALEAYIDVLLEWNAKINLVSRTVSRETVREHVVHSLLPIPLSLLERHQVWVDSGTGGGLPGIPLAICEPEKFWFLNDNVRKKMRAVNDIIETLGLENVQTIAKSISLVELKKGTGILSKHAFKIPDLLKHLGTKPWKTILMWKGAEDAESEIKESRKMLSATIYKFDFGKEEQFYEGKGLVKIER